jgi:hypothetical protein
MNWTEAPPLERHQGRAGIKNRDLSREAGCEDVWLSDRENGREKVRRPPKHNTMMIMITISTNGNGQWQSRAEEEDDGHIALLEI